MEWQIWPMGLEMPQEPFEMDSGTLSTGAGQVLPDNKLLPARTPGSSQMRLGMQDRPQHLLMARTQAHPVVRTEVHPVARQEVHQMAHTAALLTMGLPARRTMGLPARRPMRLPARRPMRLPPRLPMRLPDRQPLHRKHQAISQGKTKRR